MTSSISIQRRVQWMDTDAAGVWHHSLAIRWAEEAEAELHRQLGIIDDTFGALPRVRTEFDFALPVYFDDVVDISLTVADVGTTSVTYLLRVTAEAGTVVEGRIVAVSIDPATGEKRAWTEHLRRALQGE